jgi:hypothetical protein
MDVTSEDLSACKLLAQPFWILGVEPTASRQQIDDAFELAKDRQSISDLILAKARDILVDPAQRLWAELTYPIDSLPTARESYYAVLSADAPAEQALLFTRQLGALSRANFCAHIAANQPAAANLLEALVTAHASIDRSDIHETLQDCRRRAGYRAPSLAGIDESLGVLLDRHAMAAMAGYLAIEDAVPPMLGCVQKILALKDRDALEVLDRLLAAYDHAISHERETKLDEIQRACKTLQEKPDEGIALHLLSTALDGWVCLCSPLIDFDVHRQVMRPDLERPTELVRALISALAGREHYETAIEVADLSRKPLGVMPGAAGMLDDQLRALKAQALELQLKPLKVGPIEQGEKRLAPPTVLSPLRADLRPSEPQNFAAKANSHRSARRMAIGTGALVFVAALATAALTLDVYNVRAWMAQAIRMPTAQMPTAAVSTKEEIKPAVGTGQRFSVGNVRYCSFQEERLRVMKSAVRGPEDVRAFNLLIVDYNSRCSDFLYRDSDVATVAAERAANRQRLAVEAQHIIATWPGHAAAAEPAAMRD